MISGIKTYRYVPYVRGTERQVPGGTGRFAKKLTELISRWQGGTEQASSEYTAAVVLSSMYSMILLSPWLFNALELPLEDAARHYEGVVGILVGLIARPA